MSRSYRSPRTRTRVIPDKRNKTIEEIEILEAYQELYNTPSNCESEPDSHEVGADQTDRIS